MGMGDYLGQDQDMAISAALNIPPIGTPIHAPIRAVTREPRLTPNAKEREGTVNERREEGRMCAFQGRSLKF